MTSTTAETVALEREFVVQLIAELQAAGEISVALDHNEDTISNHFWMVAQNLRETVFGKVNAATDEEYHTNPLIVEIEAKAREIAADVLAETSNAVARLRLEAELIREKGSIDFTGGDDA